MKLALWSPLPPAPSGIADYVAESLDELSRGADVRLVSESPEAVAPAVRGRFPVDRPSESAGADLDVYHVGNSPGYAFIRKAALDRPGVLVLHDWNLHFAVLGDAIARNDRASYVGEMRRAYRGVGSTIGTQIAAGLSGSILPSLFPLNETLIESSLAVVALSRDTADRAAAAAGRPVLHLPLHYAPASITPTRAEARRALDLPESALIVTAPGLATAAKRLPSLFRAVARLVPRFPNLQLVVAGGADPEIPIERWAADDGIGPHVRVTGRVSAEDFIRHLVAADVVSLLRFPSFGEMSATLVRAMGLERVALVTAGTPLATEMPEGTVVPIDPGPYEDAELAALLARLLEDAALRDTIGRCARRHVAARHDLGATVARLIEFLGDVSARKAELSVAVAEARAEPDTLLGWFREEVRAASREIGLAGWPPGLDERLRELGRPQGEVSPA